MAIFTHIAATNICQGLPLHVYSLYLSATEVYGNDNNIEGVMVRLNLS